LVLAIDFDLRNSPVRCYYLLVFLYRYQQKLRSLQTRDRIARDLHDDMGSSLSSISILSQTAQLTATKDPERTKDTLERIGETARQVMDSMSDIIWSVNPQQDGMINVVHRLQAITDDLFGPTEVNCQINADPALLAFQLPLDKRRDFILLCKEALTNAAKYANAQYVQVQLQRINATLVVTISDDGQGFSIDKLANRTGQLGGNGLPNMRDRANKLGGHLTINADIGHGTTITLTMPI